MHKKTAVSLISFRSITTFTLLFLLVFTSCSAPPVSPPQNQLQPPVTDGGGFHKLSEAGEPLPAQLERVNTVPANPAYELRFQTGQAVANTIRMPDQGSIKVIFEVGPTNAILDSDAVTDGIARIQVTAATAYDIYLRPEQDIPPTLCQGTGSNAAVLDQMDQLVQDKANALIAAGKGQCAYLPSVSQRQNANCNSTGSGLSCSGSLSKTILMSQCPEIAVYAGALNLNNDLSAAKLFVATQNNLTINHAAKGVFATRGNLNTNLNGSRQLEGVFVSGSSSNLNLSGTPNLKGLYKLANNSPLSFNMNGNAQFEGALCTTGNLNFNRNGNTHVIYHPNVLEPWLADVSNLAGMLCEARYNFYTQNIPKTCPSPAPPATLGFSDPLYLINQTLSPVNDSSWYKMSGRPLPVPADWYSPDAGKYVLTFDNHGMSKLTARFFSQTTAPSLPQSVRVIPKVDCIQQNRLGTHTAYLSYDNQMPGVVNLPVGPYNRFEPGPESVGQPTQFQAGQSPTYPQSAHAVSFTSEQLSWTLNGRTITFQANNPSLRCQSEAIQIPSNVSVRKTLLEPTTLTFAGGQDTQRLTFEVGEPLDLKRRILLTVKIGLSGTPIDELEVRVNGQQLAPGAPSQRLVTRDFPEVSFEVVGLLRKGQNTLEVTSSGSAGSQANMQIDGFMLPLDIPGAFHSAISHDAGIRRLPVQRGIVGVKFLEGMKVRLQGSSLEGLMDESSISLGMLKALNDKITGVYPAIPGLPEKQDVSEQALQAKLNQELPNQNLFYLMTFDVNQDVWEVVDRLKVLPFVEEAFPQFIPQPSQTTPTPTSTPCPYPDELCSPGFLNDAAKREWLETTNILSHSLPPSSAPSVQPGAWNLTRGKGVKIAILEFGFTHTDLGVPTHPDLGKITYVPNVQVNTGYTDTFHGTATTGIIGATGNNGLGVAGVAHEAELFHIHYANNEQSLPSLCRGTGVPTGTCDVGNDAMDLALQRGVRIIDYEIDGGGYETPGTLEHTSPIPRARFLYLTRDEGIKNKYGFNPIIVIPAGNRACQSIPPTINNPPVPNPRWTACLALFPQGKDIRQGFFDQPIYSVNWSAIFLAYLLPPPWKMIAGAAAAAPVRVGTDSRSAPMMDTGSIIVGGLNVKGSGRIPALGSNPPPPMNFGKTGANGISGHGTDISGPAELVFTTWNQNITTPTYSGPYENMGGTSGATPVVAGVIALMLSKKPSLTPDEVRNLLRQPPVQQPLASGEDISGMIDAWQAMCSVTDCSMGIKSFGIQSIAETQPPVPQVFLWLLRETQRLAVNPNDVVGVAINDQDLSQLQIEIVNPDGSKVQANVVDIAQAQNFATFKIPADAEAGVKDVLLKIGANEVRLPNALDVQPSGPVTINYDKRDIFTNGNDWATMTIKLRKPDGSLYPDGSAFYLGIYTDKYTYGDGSPMNNPIAGTTNSEIKIRVASTRKINPGEYSGPNWPSPGDPAIQAPTICTAYYYNGYHCDQPISYDTTTQPELYLKDTYRIEFENQELPVLAAGGPVEFKAKLYDRAGLPVPDGTVFYTSATRGTFGTWSADYAISSIQNEIKFSYTPYQLNGPCWGNGYSESLYLRLYYWSDITVNYASVRYGLSPGCDP